MTSISGADLTESTQLSRRLSVLPTVLGALAVVLVVIGPSVAGIAESGTAGGWLVLVAAGCVATTIVWGHPVGLYVGLTLVVIAALLPEGSLSARSLIVVGVGLLFVHEIARPAVDARRPARFGSGVWLRHALRTVAVSILLAGAAWLATAVDGRAVPEALVPAGLALAAIPLLVRRLVTGRAAGDGVGLPLGPWFTRVGLGVLVAAVAVTAAVLGAGARAGIVNDRSGQTRETVAETTTATTNPPPGIGDSAVVQGGVSLLLFVIVLLVAGFLFVALRRPEMTFDLDELDLDDDDTLLGLAGPGQADVEAASVEIDEQTMRDLLDDLALDIAAERDPGRAIRFAYAKIEQRLADLDVVRSETETEQEFLRRALPSLGPGGGDAMVVLTDLFERARFGHGPISEAMRARALAAVDVLRAATTTAEPAANTGTAGGPAPEGNAR